MSVYIFRLEAYVSTERDVVSKTNAELVSLHVANLTEVVTELTNVCNEAHLVADTIRDTWLETKFPSVTIVFNATDVNVLVSETTVNEESEVTRLNELVTNVWVQDKGVFVNVRNTIDIIAILAVEVQISVTVTIEVSEANASSNVKFVVESVTNFRDKIEIGTSALLVSVNSSFA